MALPPIHGIEPPSAWVRRWAHLLADAQTKAEANAPQEPQEITLKATPQVLDVACGHGRHMRFLAGLGFRVLGIDRNAEALQSASQWGPTLKADIENDDWPLQNQTFQGVVVTNYLWRELFPNILSSLADEGVLIYETFSHGNASVGKPSRPDFLLRSGELLQLCAGLRVIAFEEGFLSSPDRFIQRIVATKLHPTDGHPTRYPLPSDTGRE